MPDLAELQREFAAMLLSGDAASMATLIADNDVAAAARLRIHRNTMITALEAALAISFPVVKALVGDEFFAQAARDFTLTAPPQAPLLSLYGGALPEFLASYEPASGLPYLRMWRGWNGPSIRPPAVLNSTLPNPRCPSSCNRLCWKSRRRWFFSTWTIPRKRSGGRSARWMMTRWRGSTPRQLREPSPSGAAATARRSAASRRQPRRSFERLSPALHLKRRSKQQPRSRSIRRTRSPATSFRPASPGSPF